MTGDSHHYEQPSVGQIDATALTGPHSKDGCLYLALRLQRLGKKDRLRSVHTTPRDAYRAVVKHAGTEPDDYDPYEANHDPESESAQYQEALAQYQEDLADYQERVTHARQKQQQMQQQRQMQQKQQQQARRELKQQAMYEHGLSDEQADQFIEWSTSEESLNDMSAWVEAFKATHDVQTAATSPQTSPTEQAEQTAQQKRQEVQQGPENFPQSAAGQTAARTGRTKTPSPRRTSFARRTTARPSLTTD